MHLLLIALLMLTTITKAQQPPHNLVNIQKINPRIKLDIRYATPNNFTNKAVYTSSHCFLLKETAQKIDAAQKELEPMGLGLLIFDGYRPRSVQQLFWNLVPDPRYVADPKKGSRHNSGCAVDCTLVDAQGNLLEMPTDFDDFTEKAHRDYMHASPTALKNRALLEKVMVKHGFKGLPTEWWHFDLVGWEKYPFLDVGFDELDG